MLNIKRLWSLGVQKNSPRTRRQIQLCNQIALLFTLATVFPYQLFYFIYDYTLYHDVFVANLIFIIVYLSVLLLNHKRRYATAKKVLLVNTCCQLLLVNYYISSEAGVHLYYFTLAGILLFLYQNLRTLVYFVLLATLGTLFTITHFLFSPDTAITPIPSPWVEIMYAGSVAAVLGLLGVFLMFFRNQINQAEKELNEKNDYLKMLSNTDPLTGLANRRVLDEALDTEWYRLSRNPTPLSIIMCDVDHFKLFNDRYGHNSGDHCLKQVAAVLKGVLFRPSDLAVRYGGEEFAVVLPGTDEAGARHIGERLREAVECLNIPNEDVGADAYVTVSVGASSFDHFNCHSGGPVRLLNSADKALYRAKSSGRNKVVFLGYDS
ncbi:GGDEF domain-containing protein [Vreelandella neptunia]|uniref:GGDEF domain-containing protein n=1 Tax=Vreelandella neptunia TaxID=115551 RepID=UPI00315A6920